MIYFGCINQPGHFAWENENSPMSSYTGWGKWLSDQDGKLTPRDTQREGRPMVHHLFNDTVTVVAWWDYSVDGRPGCNSMLLEMGHHPLDSMLEKAAKAFPNVMARQKWEAA